MTIAQFDHSPLALTVFGAGDAMIGDMMAFSDRCRALVQVCQIHKPPKASLGFATHFQVHNPRYQMLQLFNLLQDMSECVKPPA